jgi:NitT/TauT family transport system permease protein
MGRLGQAVTAALAYLWSGWGAIASLCLFAALWEAGAQAYGPLVLPGPIATFSTLAGMLSRGAALPELMISAKRALYGLVLAAATGSALGLVAGLSVTASVLSRPLVTLFMGMPPVAWVVLAMLWFGMGDASVVFTVFIACTPIVFAGALQGTRTLDQQLKDLGRAFRMPWHMTLFDLYIPHIASYVFPAWVTALGTSWKVVVMAELLTAPDGVGAALAVSRSHLDTAASLGWIMAVLGLLLAVEYLLLEPFKREVERWRAAAP